MRAPLLLLAALLLPASAAGGEDRRPHALPADGLVTVSGVLRAPDGEPDRFRLRVVQETFSQFPEILHDEPVEPGPFEVRLPAPESWFHVLITSDRHQPFAREYEAGAEKYRVEEPIVPVPFRRETVRVLTEDGAPVAGAVVERHLDLPGLGGIGSHPLLLETQVSDLEGSVRVRTADGCGHTLHVRADGLSNGRLELDPPGEAGGPREIRLSRPKAILLVIRDLDLRRLVVSAGTSEGFVELPKGRRKDSFYEAKLPPGSRSLHLAYPGLVPCLLSGAPLLADSRPTIYTHLADRAPRLQVQAIDPEFHPPQVPRGPRTAGCGSHAGSPLPDDWIHWVRRECRRAGAPGWSPVPGYHSKDDAWEVRIRGYLLAPRRLRVPVRRGEDHRIRVRMERGAGIRVVVRPGSGTPPKRITLQVRERSGRLALLDYTDLDLRRPSWLHTGLVLDGVPNGGVVSLPVGHHRVEIRGEDRTWRGHEVRCYPSTITRLEVR